MRILVSGATAYCRRCATKPEWQSHLQYLGHLLNPRSYNSLEYIFSTGLPVAADNDCFNRLDRKRYIRMLKRLSGSNVMWVTAPDIVAQATDTIARFWLWKPVLDYYRLPIAFVAQDGQQDIPLPWDHFYCLFIGGSTQWKEGKFAARLIQEAKDRGKWVHVGRVNTMRRRWLIDALADVDSIDGTSFSRFPDTYIPKMAATMPYKQHGMEDILL